MVAGLAGFSLMAAELTAVRLQAPWFGDSAYVWTNVIGVILAALAGGAALGGILAGRDAPARTLYRALLGAGALLAILPFLARPLGQWLLPGDLPLDAAMGGIVRGSLVATALLFGPPMVLIGMLGPLLVTALTGSGVPVGRAAGTTSGAGTLGSLVGTFAATHWLVPTFGSRATMTVTGVLLGLAALVLVLGKARRAQAIAASGLLLGLLLVSLHGGPLRAAPAGRELLAERETSYQLLQVVRERPTDAPARTLLLINEGLDSFHSIDVADSAFTGAYYDWHAAAPFFRDGAALADLRVLSIGDAAGSLREVYAHVHPNATVDGVDIDPVTMALGDEFFAATRAPGRSFAIDGRVFVNLATDAAWDVIHVDAYANQIYVPAHLASREFFEQVHARLAPGGVIALNVGALRSDDPVLRSVGTTLAAVFGHARALRVPASRNFLVVARRDRAWDVPAMTATGTKLTGDDLAQWQSIVSAVSNAAAWRDVSSGGIELVDDRPVLDELMMQSYVATDASAAIVPCDGTREPHQAELDVQAAYQVRDWVGVIAAVRSSKAPTSYLRWLAGNARWSMRELGAAAAEYRAAIALTEDPAQRESLELQLATLADERAPNEGAAAIAARNGWLAAAVVLLALVGVAMLYRMSRMPALPSVSVLVDAR